MAALSDTAVVKNHDRLDKPEHGEYGSTIETKSGVVVSKHVEPQES